MFGSGRSMAMVAVTVGVATALAGCGSSGDSGAPTTSQSTASATTAAPTTSTNGGNPSTATQITTATLAPEQQPPTTEPVALWDPCGISDADLTKQGFRADSREVLSGSGDLSCRWQSLMGKSEVTILSTRQTVQDFMQSGRYVHFTPVSVAARAANQFRAAQDTNKIGCYVGVTVPMGLVVFVTRNLQPDAPEEPCAAARRIGDAMTGYLH